MAEAGPSSCDGEPIELGMLGLRIASIFIILVASLFGAVTPILMARQTKVRVPSFTFFICKYVGTGVIVATAWMHLLDPAIKQLGDACVQERWLGSYPWPLCIALMTIMVMFFVELMVARFHNDDDDAHSQTTGSDSGSDLNEVMATKRTRAQRARNAQSEPDVENQRSLGGADSTTFPGRPDDVSYPPAGEVHLARRHSRTETASHGALTGQLTAIFILEFGVIFHSVFIGLALGTTGTDELRILLVVLVVHQTFEGLGLGSRLAVAKWPEDKQWLPYVLALGFALSTPVGVAAGVGAKPTNAAIQKLVNGIFDSISTGILMYTGLVELLAHEFMFNPHMRRASLKIQLLAFGCVTFGVIVMALLAKWA
ncbi:membrane zinc transporter [Metarhizium album ARSEF 1941]|uniref:Membrane zinc transporter n=1 Tax=Metarhizium album (strain ARSEF 1941) TaxID=1081103 RepID=A0A0B2WNF7_METAS|nr:membrane zinc transporter [Metarhizium album ARSEF 1941]KHN97591.1 membrane zinc transporter [Metarhizium album ARSEF 1941]